MHSEKILRSKITLGISSCLLGEKVRYDGRDKKDQYIVEELSQQFQFRPFCPEVEIGLGVPREPIELAMVKGKVECCMVGDHSIIVTDKLSSIADKQLIWQQKISGYILKSRSPSCAKQGVKVHQSHCKPQHSSGIYAKQLMHHLPFLPVIEETSLHTQDVRSGFLNRVYLYAHWQTLISHRTSQELLAHFHQQHAELIIAISPALADTLTKLLANAKKNPKEVLEQYQQLLMKQMN